VTALLQSATFEALSSEGSKTQTAQAAIVKKSHALDEGGWKEFADA
jgi:hypothetical protein